MTAQDTDGTTLSPPDARREARATATAVRRGRTTRPSGRRAGLGQASRTTSILRPSSSRRLEDHDPNQMTFEFDLDLGGEL